MSERIVQVPVSLPTREHIAEALWKRDFPAPFSEATDEERWQYLDYADAVLALLSQPTPTAELIACPHWEPGEITMRKGCTACAATPKPLRIEDMAPGTTFRFGKSDTPWTLYYNATFENYYVVSPDGSVWQADDIDPSTIRDVTPPKDAA